MISPPSIAFVTCIEPGILERQVVNLLASIRRLGSPFSDAEFHAIKPRLGPGPRRQTLAELERLGGIYRAHPDPGRRWWDNYLGKAKAMDLVERTSGRDVLVFLDSDMICLSEPEEILLQAGEDFAACPGPRLNWICGPGPE